MTESPVSSAIRLLKERFGHDAFLPGQERVIEHLLSGRSAAAVFPTGGGKSLCYQLPALLLEGVTLVVSPLIALMKDQIDALTRRGVPARRLDSSLTEDEVRRTLSEARSGRLKLLFVAPERFNNERFRAAMRGVRVALFAVDEAHCISEWGHNFRPDYLKLRGHARQFGAERVLALTATATPRVLHDIVSEFGIDPDCAVRTTFHRENLALRFTPVAAGDRDRLLLSRLAERPRGATIVYVTKQQTTHEVADLLASAGLPADPYHAGMTKEERSAIQERFLASHDGIIVATIAFGMGIDKPDIRYVYHYNLPKSLESYSQEVGRAGRDGEPAVCEMLACLDDLRVIEAFVYGDTPAEAAVRGIVDELFSGDENPLVLDLHGLSFRFDIRPLVLKTLLVRLELDGFLEGGTPEFSRYRFVPKQTSEEILSAYSGEDRDFLVEVLRRVEKKRTWFHVDPERIAGETGEPRQRVVRALADLADRGLVDLRAEGVRLRYFRREAPRDLEGLAAELHAQAKRREEAELRRARKVIDLVEADACQASELGAWFGEPLKRPCGRCTHCLHGPVRMPPANPVEIDERILDRALDMRDEHALLSDPLALARFLSGVSSPAIQRARLSKDALFGALSNAPFSDVLAAAKRRLSR